MDFQDLLKRRTIRQFRQQEIPEADIRSMINAARKASCAANRQRLRYIAIRTKALTDAILPLTAYAALVTPKRNPVPGISAPAAFLAVTATERPSPHLWADAGAAIQSIEFAAWERGIGCCWLGSFQKEKTAELLAVPDPEKLLYLIALGYSQETPCEDEISKDGDPKYYLDDRNVLHVPKYSVDSLLEWK